MIIPNRIDLTMLDSELNDLEPIPIAYSFSDTQFEIVKKYVSDFEKSLDNEHEVGMLLTNFGQSQLIAVTHIGYEKSVILVFKGYVINGYISSQQATLIQHISQLNFLLVAVPKPTDRQKVVIGFDVS
jgi:hypothetical protein